MSKKNLDYVRPQPARRPLKIYAFDPMLGRTPENRITIDIPNEPVGPGPASGASLTSSSKQTCQSED